MNVLLAIAIAIIGITPAWGEQHPILWRTAKAEPIEEAEIGIALGVAGALQMKPLSGGHSGGLLYELDIGDSRFIARRSGGIFGLAGVPQEICIMQAASEAGISPSVLYADPEKALVVMERVNNLLPAHFTSSYLSRWGDLEDKVADLLRRLHVLEPDPSIVTDRYTEEYYNDLLSKFDQTQLTEADRAILDKLALCEWPRGKKTLCHNDVHGRNMLFDGHRLYLVDWETAGWGPPLYDVAMFSNSQLMTVEQGKIFLQLYLQRVPTAQEFRDFAALRKLNVAWGAVLLMGVGKASQPEAYRYLKTDSPITTLRNLYMGVEEEVIPYEDPERLFAMGLAWLRFADYLMQE